MAPQYPNEIATLTNPIAGDFLNQPSTGVPHSVIETRQNEEIIAIETELGTGLKGSKTTLADRIAIGINEDGTLKSELIDSTVIPFSKSGMTSTNIYDAIVEAYNNSGSGSQTPWLSEINADDNNLVNLNYIDFNGTFQLSEVSFVGVGLDDMTASGGSESQGLLSFIVEIDSEGTPDTFKFSSDGGVSWEGTNVEITGSTQSLTVGLVSITFNTTTGHTLGDRWLFYQTIPLINLPDKSTFVWQDENNVWRGISFVNEEFRINANIDFSGEFTASYDTSYIAVEEGGLYLGSASNTIEIEGVSTRIILDYSFTTDTRTYTFPDATGNILLDAPSDGTIYARQNAMWIEVTSGGSQTPWISEIDADTYGIINLSNITFVEEGTDLVVIQQSVEGQDGGNIRLISGASYSSNSGAYLYLNGGSEDGGIGEGTAELSAGSFGVYGGGNFWFLGGQDGVGGDAYIYGGGSADYNGAYINCGGATATANGVISFWGKEYQFSEEIESYKGILSFSSITEDRTYTFPNATGTIALTSDIITYTEGDGINIDSSNIISLDTGYTDLSYLKLDQTTAQTVTASPIFDWMTASQLLATDANKKLVSLSTATYPSLAELSYVKGVTSAIQTQLSGKQPLDADLTAIAALGFTATAFLKKTAANTWALDTNTYLTSVTAHNILSTTHGDTTAASVVRGDLITGQGATPKWTRLGKGSANQVLSMDATGTDIVWATSSGGSPGGLDTYVQFNDGGVFGGDADFTWNKATNRLTTGGLYIKSIPDYYVPTAFTYSGTAGFISGQDYFMCKNGQVAIHEGTTHSTWGYTGPRLRLDVVGANETFEELSLPGSAIFEYNTGDRNRVFLVNKFPILNSGVGSSSSVIHWALFSENYPSADGIKSDWELGNDYWLGINPDDFVTNKWYETGGHNFYLWDSVNSLAKILITNSLIESWTYDSILASNQRMFALKNYDGGSNSIFIGRNSGNYFGDTTYGGSICIGIDAGYNKSSAGSNIFIGHWTGYNQTNGSNIVALGNGSGGAIDGDYNTCLGHFCASAGGAYNYSTQSLYVGNYINAGFGIYRVIIDTSGGTHNTYLKSSRHSLMFGTCNPSSPQKNSLYLNAEVEVQGLNSMVHREIGQARFNRFTGEQLFTRRR